MVSTTSLIVTQQRPTVKHPLASLAICSRVARWNFQ